MPNACWRWRCERERALVVAYQRHWMPHFVYARELVRKGALGEIRGVVAYVTQRWVGVGGWRLDPKLAGGGMFMDTGSHLVASLLWVTGLRPRTVSATFDNAGHDVDINGGLAIVFAGNAIGRSPPRAMLCTTMNALRSPAARGRWCCTCISGKCARCC